MSMCLGCNKELVGLQRSYCSDRCRMQVKRTANPNKSEQVQSEQPKANTVDQPDISQLPPGVSIPISTRTSQTQAMPYTQLQDRMRACDHDTWLASPEYAEVIYRLLNHTIDQLKADDQFIPAWRRQMGEKAA